MSRLATYTKACYRELKRMKSYLQTSQTYLAQTPEKSPSIYSPSILTQKEQSIFATLLFSPEWEDIFSPAQIQKGQMNSSQSMLSYWLKFSFF